MKITEKTVSKTVSMKIEEYYNFYFMDGRILLKKHAALLQLPIWSMGYDDIKKCEFPAYQVKDRQNITAIADWSIRGYSGPEHKNHWVAKCYRDEKGPTIAQLIMADENPAEHLFWFCGNDHSLWDINMVPVSTPIHLDYIDAQLHNGAYKLKSARAHLESLPPTLVSDKYISPIIGIPGYNCNEGCDKYILAEIRLTQEKFVEFYGKCGKRKEKESAVYHRLGYQLLDYYDKKQVIMEMLGLDQFKKPEIPEDDE
jgi:hypothetical protein